MPQSHPWAPMDSSYKGPFLSPGRAHPGRPLRVGHSCRDPAGLLTRLESYSHSCLSCSLPILLSATETRRGSRTRGTPDLRATPGQGPHRPSLRPSSPEKASGADRGPADAHSPIPFVSLLSAVHNDLEQAQLRSTLFPLFVLCHRQIKRSFSVSKL